MIRLRLTVSCAVVLAVALALQNSLRPSDDYRTLSRSEAEGLRGGLFQSCLGTTPCPTCVPYATCLFFFVCYGSGGNDGCSPGAHPACTTNCTTASCTPTTCGVSIVRTGCPTLGFLVCGPVGPCVATTSACPAPC